MKDIRTRIKTLGIDPALHPEELTLAGVVAGVLFCFGGLTIALLMLLPGVSHEHEAVVLAIAGFGLMVGLLALLVVDWSRAPRWLLQVAIGLAILLVGLATASSGGSRSPAWVYMFLAAVFAAYFFAQRIAFLYLAACAITQAIVLLYDPRALHNGFVAELVIASTAYLLLGGAIVSGRRQMLRLRTRAETLAAEQSALRRVATAVVGGESAERIYALVALEVAELLHGAAAEILRFDSRHTAKVMGSWADHTGGRYLPGSTVDVRSGAEIELARQTGRPVSSNDHPADSPVAKLGYGASVVAPISVGGQVWGVLAASSPRPFSPRDEARLMAFGDLLATAVASIEDRAKLAREASSDPLTGLANHRTLQQRIASEVARSIRHERPLSVAVIDIDHFKQINDNAGHEVGDTTLIKVAAALRKFARAEDTLGRTGGDEFVWVLPETAREQALIAVERARRVIAELLADPYGITVSAGICDTSVSTDPAQLLRLADGALYWSKTNGRDRCWIYDPEIVGELSAQERAQRLQRSNALAGVRALARAVDAKDPLTGRHSERVAELVGKLARNAGWLPERARLLADAALVHDVGKVGLSEDLLRKLGPLTEAEWEQVRLHAELSARIAADVLTSEQVDWIRSHHERPDGLGYPHGLRAAEIPEGAALLAIADAWDAMTVSRPYGVPKSTEQALAECSGLVDRQFTRVAVDALIALNREAGFSANAGEPLRARAGS